VLDFIPSTQHPASEEQFMKHQLLIVALFIVFSLGVGLTPVSSQANAPMLSGT
jgi:hypothetical protein